MGRYDSVSAQMEDLLDEVNLEVRQVTEESIDASSKAAVKKLRENSPKRKGDYAKGWAVKKEDKLTRVVYNKTHYQLTHLLENGHVVKNQHGEYGRVNGEKHIEPVEEWAANDVVERIERGL